MATLNRIVRQSSSNIAGTRPDQLDYALIVAIKDSQSYKKTSERTLASTACFAD